MYSFIFVLKVIVAIYIQRKEDDMKAQTDLKIVVILLMGLLLAACGPTGCDIQSMDYRNGVNSLASEWDQTNKLANSTPRIQLATVISELQAERNKVSDLYAPDCAQNAQQLLLSYMDETIDGYLSFLADDPATTVQAHFTKANQLFTEWSGAFAQLAKH
jgi:hypothetical protein